MGPRTLQQCQNFFDIIVLQFVGHLLSGSMLGLMATSSKKIYATLCVSQVCCSQSPCPCGRLLLTCASAGDTQMLKGRSGLVSCDVSGSWCPQVLLEPSKHLWASAWNLNLVSPILLSCWGSFIAVLIYVLAIGLFYFLFYNLDSFHLIFFSDYCG